MQGLLDIHAVRSTPSATGSGLDQPSSSQLQHWAVTEKPEGMVVDASGQQQAADSGHSLVASASESAAAGVQDADPARQHDYSPQHSPEHAATSSVLHVAPTLRQLQQPTALTYKSTWRPGQDPWLPLVPHAPKQNLRAWKTVPSACPQEQSKKPTAFT